MSTEDEGHLELALRQWKDRLGQSQVVDDPHALQTYLSDVAEYPKREGIAVLHAASVADVQHILQVANRNLVPVYPISSGRNWGFGSAKPVADGCAVIDLGGMNRIRELNLERGYAIIEPGVTQRILSEALQGKPYLLNTTGSCRDTSIIGNALERGVGFFRQRTEDVVGLEVILANGDVLRVGSFWSNRIDSFHYKHGVGPDLLPMFSQSNFGVVTAAAISLIPQPERMCLVQAQFRRDRLKDAVDVFASLYQQGLFRVVCKAFNSSAMHTYGMDSESQGNGHGVEFTFFGALMGSTKTVSCIETLVMEELEQTGYFYNLRSIDRDRWPSEVPDHIALPFQGIPTCEYIENSFGTPCCDVDAKAEIGMFLFVPVVPLDGNSISIAYGILEQTARDYDMPINASINMIPPAAVNLVVSISFIRTPGAIDQVHRVKEVLHREFRKWDLVPYRADIQHHEPSSMYESQTRSALLRNLKLALDPNNVIAPDRYVSMKPPKTIPAIDANSG